MGSQGRGRRWRVGRKVEELLEKGRRLKNGKRGEIHDTQTLAFAGKGFSLMAPPEKGAVFFICNAPLQKQSPETGMKSPHSQPHSSLQC